MPGAVLCAALLAGLAAQPASRPAHAAPVPAPALDRWFAAVRRGDVAAVRAQARARRALLERWNHPQGDTALMVAANRCDLPMVKALLALGADPNAAPHVRYRTTPLSMALMGNVYGGPEKGEEAMNATLELLLAGGAAPDQWYTPGEGAPRTTAVLAAAELLPSTLKVLLAHRGDASLRDGQDRSPAILALRSADRGLSDAQVREKLEALLAAGHPLPAGEREAADWLGLAWGHRLEETEALLAARGVALPARGEYGLYLSVMAASSGWLPRLERALARRPDLRDARYRPPLAAALARAVRVVERHPGWLPDVERAAVRLLEAGASPADAAPGGSPPLALAAQLGAAALVERLIASPGVQLDAAGEDGRTALHLAAEAGRVEVVELLLRRGAAPTLADARGDSPLVAGARALRHEVLAPLLGAAPAERPRALEAVLGAACRADERERAGLERLGAVLAALAAGAPLPEAQAQRLQACAPALLRGLALPQPALAPGETAEALVLRAPEAELARWHAAWARMQPALVPWLELAAPLPRVAGPAELGEAPGSPGGGPGLLLGVCRRGEGVVQERWLRALLPEVERRPVAWSGPLACPAAVTPLGPSVATRHRVRGVPGYQALVIAPAPAGTAARGFVAVTVSEGGLAGFGVGDDGGYAARCAGDYDEEPSFEGGEGRITLTCGERRRRWRVRRQGQGDETLVFRPER